MVGEIKTLVPVSHLDPSATDVTLYSSKTRRWHQHCVRLYNGDWAYYHPDDTDRQSPVLLEGNVYFEDVKEL